MKKKKYETIITSVLLLCLILVVIGVSFAFFTYSRQGSRENTIITGSLTFIYDEQQKEGNGITLDNAFPMSDETGKTQIGNNNVFDFQVLATTAGESIFYEVIGEKDEASTLAEEMVKIYLTSLNGSVEEEISTTVKDGSVTTYDELIDTTIVDQKGKTLYQDIVPEGQKNYLKSFRLRMWIKDEEEIDTDGQWDNNSKFFTIRINVIAGGENVSEVLPLSNITATKEDGSAIVSDTWSTEPVTLVANVINVAQGSTYQWQECTTEDTSSCIDIDDATQSKYVVQKEGIHRYRVVVTTPTGLIGTSEQFITKIDTTDYQLSITGGSGGSITVRNEDSQVEVTVGPGEEMKVLQAKMGDRITVSATTNDGYQNLVLTKNGEQIDNPSNFIMSQENVEISASWEAKTFHLTYDYEQNGGTSVSQEEVELPYQSNVDLTVVASKDGFTFLGWNTDPNATVALSSYQMPNQDTTLYAIYKKDVTITYVDTETKNSTCTIYNNDIECSITLGEVNAKSGYDISGWRTDTEASEAIYQANSTQSFSNDITLYAVWSKVVHLYSYDGTTLVNDSSGTVYSNASGTHSSFTASFGPTRSLSGYIFKGYRINNTGTIYGAGTTYAIQDDVSAYVYWIQTTVTLTVRCDVGGYLSQYGQGAHTREATCKSSYDITPYNKAVFTFTATGHVYYQNLYGNVFFYAYAGDNNNRVALTGSGEYRNQTVTVTLSKKSTNAKLSVMAWNDARAVQEYYNTMYCDKIVLSA